MPTLVIESKKQLLAYLAKHPEKLDFKTHAPALESFFKKNPNPGPEIVQFIIQTALVTYPALFAALKQDKTLEGVGILKEHYSNKSCNLDEPESFLENLLSEALAPSPGVKTTCTATVKKTLSLFLMDLEENDLKQELKTIRKLGPMHRLVEHLTPEAKKTKFEFLKEALMTQLHEDEKMASEINDITRLWTCATRLLSTIRALIEVTPDDKLDELREKHYEIIYHLGFKFKLVMPEDERTQLAYEKGIIIACQVLNDEMRASSGKNVIKYFKRMPGEFLDFNSPISSSRIILGSSFMDLLCQEPELRKGLNTLSQHSKDTWLSELEPSNSSFLYLLIAFILDPDNQRRLEDIVNSIIKESKDSSANQATTNQKITNLLTVVAENNEAQSYLKTNQAFNDLISESDKADNWPKWLKLTPSLIANVLGQLSINLFKTINFSTILTQTPETMRHFKQPKDGGCCFPPQLLGAITDGALLIQLAKANDDDEETLKTLESMSYLCSTPEQEVEFNALLARTPQEEATPTATGSTGSTASMHRKLVDKSDKKTDQIIRDFHYG